MIPAELLERRIILDAALYAKECGLKPPFNEITVRYEDSAIRAVVSEKEGKFRQGTCSYTPKGVRAMYELERGK